MLRAVAFDYRDTLAEFRWDEALWRRGVRALVAAVGADPDEAGRVGEGLRRRFTRSDADLAELDYLGAVTAALAEAGIEVAPAAVRRGIEAEFRAWAPARHVHPDAAALLDGVRALGLRTALAANTFDPPELFRADLEAQGIGGRVDAVVLSCEVGVRKPHPGFYAAVAEALGVAPGAVHVRGRQPARRRASARPTRACAPALPPGTGSDPEAGGRGCGDLHRNPARAGDSGRDCRIRIGR